MRVLFRTRKLQTEGASATYESFISCPKSCDSLTRLSCRRVSSDVVGQCSIDSIYPPYQLVWLQSDILVGPVLSLYNLSNPFSSDENVNEIKEKSPNNRQFSSQSQKIFKFDNLRVQEKTLSSRDALQGPRKRPNWEIGLPPTSPNLEFLFQFGVSWDFDLDFLSTWIFSRHEVFPTCSFSSIGSFLTWIFFT